MLPDLTTYHWITINSSAGKDSQAMLDVVVEQCDQVGVPRSRLVVAHADEEPFVHFDEGESPDFLHAAVRQYLDLPPATNLAGRQDAVLP
jgi:hypothetical protein